jgi:predicted outer membrane repeat protein
VISGAGQIFIDSGTVTVTYSCVRDDEVNGGSVYPGTGNIDADPSLVDPDGLDNVFGTLDDNLALTFPAPVSPCTDTGLNAAIPKDVGDLDFDGDLVEDIPFDLVGFSRVFSIVDMGALESGLTLAPPRLFVNHAATGSNNGTSWENAYTELSAAVFQAGNSQGAVSEIWVATGTYRPTSAGGDRETSFELASGLRITGGFVSGAMSLAESDSLMNPTVMSGDLNGDDSGVDNKSENSHHVVTADFGVDDTGILEGFTISGGNANGVGQLSQGSGIHIVGGDPQILNCIFTDGLATADGSAVYIINGNPIFLDCTIFGNTGVNGTVFASGGEPLFGRCVFRNNQAGIGGGIYAVSTRAVVMNSYILSNTAVSGGGLFSVGASGEFLNCLFSGNTAEVGAGLYSFLDIEDGFRVTNCTVTGNTANVTAGGLFNSDSSIPSMSNCIVWANTDGGVDIPSAQIFNESASSATLVNHSCVQDDDASDASVYAGTNNIDDDPQFLDADGIDDTFGTLDDNPAPDGGSPVIDAGDNSVVSADVLDLDADANDTEAVPLDLLLNTRFRNVTTDMGAIEFDPAKSSIVFYMADSDLDGDVDGVDFAKFAQCFNKAGNPPRTLGCPPENADIFDFDDDADVDGVDFAQFAQCFNKAGNPPRTLGCQAY